MQLFVLTVNWEVFFKVKFIRKLYTYISCVVGIQTWKTSSAKWLIVLATGTPSQYSNETEVWTYSFCVLTDCNKIANILIEKKRIYLWTPNKFCIFMRRQTKYWFYNNLVSLLVFLHDNDELLSISVRERI